MNKLGFGEFLIIMIIALVVLGPDKLPQAARGLGKAIRSVKKYIAEASKELEIDELKNVQKDIKGIQTDLKNMGSDLEKSLTEDAGKVQEQVKAVSDEVNTAVAAADKPLPPAQPAPKTSESESAPAAEETVQNGGEPEPSGDAPKE